MNSIYDFELKSIDGARMPLSQFKGQAILLVNTASACGFTPQYAGLEKLWIANKEKSLVVIGVPCNDFGGQEPDGEAAIQQFCTLHYGVTFPLTEKVGILQNTHPIYHFLTKKSENGFKDTDVRWNFQKYLLNTEGVLERVLSSATSPLDDVVMDWIAH